MLSPVNTLSTLRLQKNGQVEKSIKIEKDIKERWRRISYCVPQNLCSVPHLEKGTNLYK